MTPDDRAKLYARLVYFWLLEQHRPDTPRVTRGTSRLAALLLQSEGWIANHMPRVLAQLTAGDLEVVWRNGRLVSTMHQSDTSLSDDVRLVFEHWKEVMKKPRATLKVDRRRAVVRMLKVYTVAELCEAIDGCAASEWHMGQNDESMVHNDLELICRKEAHVDRFRSKVEERESNVLDMRARFAAVTGGG